MNTDGFIALLNQLNDDDWQAIIAGSGLLLVDDQILKIGPATAHNTIVHSADYSSSDLSTIKNNVLSDAEQLLAQYYLRHPLSQTGFNRQVDRYIKKHGASAFAAIYGNIPQYTLFVDGGDVILESSESPRHRYGVYCEIDQSLTASAVEKQVNQWLANGEAYQQYLAMNVCRYNC